MRDGLGQVRTEVQGEAPKVNPQTQAEIFLKTHRAEMEQGARLLWERGFPWLCELMRRRHLNPRAFDTEAQNAPNKSDSAFFKTIPLYSKLPEKGALFGSVDPSMGKAGGDPCAILVGMMSEDKTLYVLEVIITSLRPDEIINRVIQLQKQYRCVAWAVETIQYQEFLKTELMKRSLQAGIPVPAVPVKPTAQKEFRIESLQPFLAQGMIQLRPEHHTLIEQLSFYPEARHDDGPDALHMLWELAVKRNLKFEYQGARGGGSSRGGRGFSGGRGRDKGPQADTQVSSSDPGGEVGANPAFLQSHEGDLREGSGGAEREDPRHA